jgi:hypothetical protein
MHKIGTQYKPIGKDYVCTVVDVWTTKNLLGEVVKIRYVAEHNFCGQTVTDNDVLGVTISRGQL